MSNQTPTLAEIRAELGLTQEEAAGTAGISRKALCQIETGRTHPRPLTIAALARAYGRTQREIAMAYAAAIEEASA
jgi:DNA-binding XRE family transcriptional regulator